MLFMCKRVLVLFMQVGYHSSQKVQQVLKNIHEHIGFLNLFLCSYYYDILDLQLNSISAMVYVQLRVCLRFMLGFLKFAIKFLKSESNHEFLLMEIHF